MRHENIKAVDHLRQRDRAVLFPIVEGFSAVDVHDEIVLLAWKMHLTLLGVSTRHFR